ncbi:MAG: hypothetical protein ACOYOF_18025, partial [Verrucomicrobiaceae bacterium]
MKTRSILALSCALAACYTAHAGTITDGALTVVIDDNNGAIQSAQLGGKEYFRLGTFVSDWGLQVGTDTTTFRVNNANATEGIPVTVSGTTATGTYSAGGATISASRTYNAVPGQNTLRITNSFTNTGSSSVSLRYFDTFDPDQGTGFSGYNTPSTQNDVLIVSGRSVAQASIPASTVHTLILSAPSLTPVLSAGGAFQISSGAILNAEQSTPTDGNGTSADLGLHLIADQVILPGSSWTFDVYVTFGTSVATAQASFTSAVTYSAPLDPTFSADGIQTTAFPGEALARGVAVQPDGKVIAAGRTGSGSSNDCALVRYQADGSLDPSFGTGGIVVADLAGSAREDYATAIALQSDGKIVVVGLAHNGTNFDMLVARFLSTGVLDTTFDGDGKAITTFGSGHDAAYGVCVMADGRIVVAGYTASGSNLDFALARYNTDGSLDNWLDGDGKLTTAVGAGNESAEAVIVQPDGKIIAAGTTSNGSNDDIAIVRYTATGALDGTFGVGGKATLDFSVNDYAMSLALQPDGRVVCGGFMINGGGARDGFLLRYLANGTLDPTFDGDGKKSYQLGSGNDELRSVAVQADGRIVAAGFTTAGAHDDMGLLRVNPDGSLDTTFDGDGIITLAPGPTFDRLFATALDANGNIVGAGLSTNAGGVSEFAVVRVLGLPKPGVWNLAAAQGAGGADLGISGQIDPAGLSTTVALEYGTTNALGSTQSVGTLTGSGLQNFNATLYPGGLTIGTTYHYRIVATNANGTTTSATTSFFYGPGTPDSAFAGDGIQTTAFPGEALARGVA